MNLTSKETDMTPGKRLGRLPVIVAIPCLAITAFIAVATAAQAIGQDSWAPIWSIGWLPAVLVASLLMPAPGTSRRLRRRGLARR
jgi:hypothetical protein